MVWVGEDVPAPRGSEESDAGDKSPEVSGDTKSATTGTDRAAVGLRAGAADCPEAGRPSNGEDRSGRSVWPEVFFGGMLRRLTEGSA